MHGIMMKILTPDVHHCDDMSELIFKCILADGQEKF